MTDTAAPEIETSVDASPTPPAPEGPASAPADWKQWVRAIGTGAYLGVLGIYIAYRGLPLDREQVILWIVIGLVVSTFGRAKSWQVVVDWLPFALLMVAYDYTRGFARTIDLPIHYTPQIDVDRFLFFGHVPTVWLQERLAQPNPHWWQVFVTLAYLSHFILPFAVAGILWFRNRQSFLAFAGRFLTLAYLGLVTYVLFPAAPPWIAAENGPISLRDGHAPYIGTVHRVVNQGWDLLGLHRAANVIEKGQATVNLFAAVPSLHAAFAALVSAFLWTRVNRWWRPLLVVYPVLMGFSLVFGGEHYVSDILLGWLYVAAVMFGWNRWDRHRAKKNGAAVTEDPAPRPTRRGEREGETPGSPLALTSIRLRRSRQRKQRGRKAAQNPRLETSGFQTKAKRQPSLTMPMRTAWRTAWVRSRASSFW